MIKTTQINKIIRKETIREIEEIIEVEEEEGVEIIMEEVEVVDNTIIEKNLKT